MKFAAFMLATSLLFSQNKPATTLYERIGRYDAIASVADDYLKGIRSDPRFARFAGRSTDSLVRARQLLKDQLCALTGGPCVYVGRDMATAHAGLAITDAEWDANMKYMAAALDKNRIVGREKEEFLAVIESLRRQIASGN